MRKLSFLIVIALASCTHYKTISYQEAKVIDGKLTVQPDVMTKKVHMGQIHWMHKNTKFAEGQTINFITKPAKRRQTKETMYKKPLNITHSVEITAEWGNQEGNYTDVIISCDLSVENDSIGSYEYWGAKCFDNQPDYFVPDGDIEWDRSKYTYAENEGIEEYVNTNTKSLYDQIINSFSFQLSNCQ